MNPLSSDLWLRGQGQAFLGAVAALWPLLSWGPARPRRPLPPASHLCPTFSRPAFYFR